MGLFWFGIGMFCGGVLMMAVLYFGMKIENASDEASSTEESKSGVQPFVLKDKHTRLDEVRVSAEFYMEDLLTNSKTTKRFVENKIAERLGKKIMPYAYIRRVEDPLMQTITFEARVLVEPKEEGVKDAFEM